MCRSIFKAAIMAAAVSFVVSIAYYVLPSFERGDRLSDLLSFAMFVGLVSAMVGLVAASLLLLILRSPLAKLAKRLGLNSSTSYVIAGTILAFLLSAAIWYANKVLAILQLHEIKMAIIAILLCGPSIALIYWKESNRQFEGKVHH